MSGHEQIKRAFRWIGITHEATLRANCMQPVSAPGDEFLGIDLVARIPDQTIVTKVKCQVKCQTEFDNTQVAGKMSRPATDNSNQFTAHFTR